MKHILNNLSEEEKNAIREQHAGGMKVMTENFSKLINAKLGDSKPLVEQPQVPPPPRPGVGRQTPQTTPPASQPSTQGILGLTTYPLIQIINGSGTSDQKVKSLCNLCRNTKSQITSTGNQLADKIRDAVQGAGTDESKIIEVIRSLRDFNEFCSMVKAYQSSYNADLYSDLDGDIDQESEWVQIFRPIRDLALKQKNTGIPSKNPTPPVKPKPSNFVDPKVKLQQMMQGQTTRPSTTPPSRPAVPPPAQSTRPRR